MILQTVPEGSPHFVIRVDEHTRLSDLFAGLFGNDDFEEIDDAVLETRVSILLTVLTSFWVCWATEHRQPGMQDELSVCKDRKPGP